MLPTSASLTEALDNEMILSELDTFNTSSNKGMFCIGDIKSEQEQEDNICQWLDDAAKVKKEEMDDIFSDISSQNGGLSSPASSSSLLGQDDSMGSAAAANAFMDGLMDLNTLDLDTDGHETFEDLFAGDGSTIFDDLHLQSLENKDGKPDDTIKTDLMWGASLNDSLNSTSAKKSRKRTRLESETSIECADALFHGVVDINSDMFNNSDILGTSPGVNDMLNAYMRGGNGDEEEEEDDEEVDVVSDCDGASSSSSTISATSTGSYGQNSLSSASSTSAAAAAAHHHRQPHRNNIQAGRSLLRSRQPRPQVVAVQQPQPFIDHATGDHCYFSSQPETNATVTVPAGPISPQGLLTPVESSDDDAENDSTSATMIRATSLLAAQGTRRRIAQAASSLSRQQQQSKGKTIPGMEHRKKFTFKVKCNKDQKSLLTVNNVKSSSSTSAKRMRSAALKNEHCPSPTKAEALAQQEQFSCAKAPQPKRQRLSGKFGSASERPPVSQEQKCREIRDLHNSMERQRRVDLRNNFDHLKDRVPELRNQDKASKLNILNKSAEYCKFLLRTEVHQKQEKDALAARNQALNQRLQQLVRSFGRAGGNSSRHCY